MKLFIVMLFAVFTAFAALPTTQDEMALVKAMKTMQPLAGSLRQGIQAKDPEAVKTAAATLEENFKTSEEFWKARKAQDAVEWSIAGKEAAAEIGKAAAASEWDKIPELQKKVGATCSACHAAHREKTADGGYKIK